jgi:HEXXH motif-containing protein
MAVADVWRGRAARTGAGQDEAEKNYVQYRDWTLAAIETLRDSGSLTELGLSFVNQMAGELSRWH